MKKILNRLTTMGLTIVIAMSCMMPIPTEASILEDARNAKAASEEDLSEVNKEIDAIKIEQDKLQEEIDKLDADLVDALLNIELLKEEISVKKEELIKAKDNYAAAKIVEDEQYDAMKLRIQYMYENGESDVITALLTTEDFSDVINKSELANEVYKYDRNQLDIFIAATKKVEETLIIIKDEEAELEENESAYITEQINLDKMLSEKNDKSDEFKKQLDEAQSLASKYKSTIEKQNRIINQQLNIQPSTSGGSYTATGSGTGTEVANFALQYVGNPYVWGGESLTNGADCSGFVLAVYKHFGVSLPHSANAQASYGRAVSSPQPGDLICYSGHIAIYIGDGKIVHASTPSTGIKISNKWNYKYVKSIRRFF